MRVVDRTGRRYDKLLVVRRVYKKDGVAPPYPSVAGLALWLCRCDCGKSKVVASSYLRGARPKIKSCGCVRTAVRGGALRWKGFGEISGEYWARVARNADKRGLPVTITIEEAWRLFELQDRRCKLSGLPLQFATGQLSRGTCTASIDRIDSNLGYVPGNVQWLHKDINRLKDYFSDARVIELCELVVKHQRARRRRAKRKT